MSNSGREYKLTSPKEYLNQNTNIFSRFFSKFTKAEIKSDEGSWYYVHFLIKDLHQLSQTLQFTIRNAVIKNTFLIYLKESQLDLIKDVSLISKLEPSDRAIEDGGPIEKVIYFLVSTTPNFTLPPNPNLYTIVRTNSEDSYLLQIDSTGITDALQYTKKKKTAAEYLSQISEVKSISTYSPPKIKNNLMTGYTQKNTAISNRKTDPNSNLEYLERYLNAKGLNGEGEIITIQDTPIDFYHSMFYDPAVTMKLNTHLPNHRKIIYYGYTSDAMTSLLGKMEENEHGTHVAGTTAGKSNCQNDATSGTSLFNGNAPDAKILYAGGLNDVSSTQLATLMRKYESYISTNSWGVDGYNDRINYEYGKLAFDNPDFLFLFAAGNEYDQGNFTVCDPGGSKNVLTVGAIGDFLEDYHTYKVESVSDPSLSVEVDTLLDTDPWVIGPVSGADDKKKKERKVLILDATQSSDCGHVFGDWVTILYGENSDQLNKLIKCPQKDTLGLLYTYNRKILDILNKGGNVKITDNTKFNNTKPITHADYSSGGPGNKGILKPDIMTPGTHITSAKSHPKVDNIHGCRDNENDFTFMQGTSMATPNAAGAVALVREYFKKKWPYKSVVLDGVSMRALMINSCVHPFKAKIPDVLFGHGVVDLSTILPFDNTFGVQMTNPEKLPSISESSHLVATIEVNSKNVDFQVTMSYLDPMLEQTSIVPLTRDLDLVVVSRTNKKFIGDHLESEDAQHFSTNEKVIIRKDEIEVGTYYIHVYSNDFMDTGLSTDRQKFSVVATGDVKNQFLQFGVPVATLPTPTASPYPTPTASRSPSPSASKSPSATQSASASQSASPSVSQSPTASRSPSISPIGTPPPSETPTPSESASASASATQSPTESPTESPSISPSPSVSQSPTESPTASVSQSPTESPTASVSQSPTPPPTFTPSFTPTQSATASQSPLIPFETETPIATISPLQTYLPLKTPDPVEYEDVDNNYIEITCPCAQCDPMNPSECKCDQYHIGSFCQAEISIVNDKKFQFTVASLEVKRVKFISKKDILSIKSKASSFFDNVTLWYSEDCYVSINEYDHVTRAGIFLSKAVNLDNPSKTICVAIFNNNFESSTYTVEVSEKKNYTSIIVGVICAVVIVVVVIVLIVLYKKGKLSCLSSLLPCCGKLGVSNT